ncbi:MAG TPA: trypsin-like peptidase domain-containing protein [Solirubrobacterales bacterium]|jgi:S1-C subfamily serine protease|nr:trypsin-like peptidase domain-containing protein [Solirubrobacterales bacterium]
MAQPSGFIDGAGRFLRAPFGSALLGGLVVGLFGWIAIAAGWIDGDDDGGASLSAAPLTRPAADRDDGRDALVGEIYDRVSPGVAFVQADRPSQEPSALNPFPQPDGATASGSGFVIDDEGHILTNAHVVQGAGDIQVTLGEDEDPVDAELVGKDTSTDVAVLQVDPDDTELHPLTLGSSSELQVGDPVVAIGNPFGLERTVTTGIVSALQRQIKAPNGFTISDVVQTDAAINPGNSGGALLDQNGQVIGINSQIATAGGGGSVGVGFAVPIDTARDVANQILDTGEVEHAFLGISGADLTPEIADALNLDVEEGALVQRVVPDGPADQAGIEAGDQQVAVGGQQIVAGGDVITAVDGESVTAMDDVIAAVNTKQAGDEVTLQVNRDGDTQDVTVELDERPAQARN